MGNDRLLGYAIRRRCWWLATLFLVTGVAFGEDGQVAPADKAEAKEDSEPTKPQVKKKLVLRASGAKATSDDAKSDDQPAKKTAKSETKAAPTVVVEVAGHAIPKSISEGPATHKQTLIVKVNGKGPHAKLEDFCLDADGNVLALVTPATPRTAKGGILGLLLGEVTEGETETPAKETAATETTVEKDAADVTAGKKPENRGSSVRVFDAAGNQTGEWSVGFIAQAINTSGDGTILVGGNGKVARFDATGKKLHEGDSPQMEYIRKNPEEMRERAKEQIESQKEMVKQNVAVYEQQMKLLEEKPEADLTAAEKQQKRIFASQISAMKTYAEQVGKKTIEQAVQEVTDRALRTHSICASDKDVFIVCPAMAGYGFGVWRTTADFAEPKEIVKSLSGCCGQMDVQCHGGELFVAENSRHRVIRYDREGKQVATFGKRDRDGEGEGFGSCCNPMNTCFTKSGELYVAESNGVVKHFTPDGKYVGVVGVAKVTPGCKNSAIGITADKSRLYYIDIEKSEIILLTKQAALSAK